jgi:Rrf2 family iron-responsive transcriptional regulator
MRLTTQSSLAIRMLLYCAANEGRLSQVGRIAEAYSVSALHLAQIMKPLVDRGLLDTVRGRHGGIRLRKAASDISLADVVRATEPIMTSHRNTSDRDDPDTADLALQAAFDSFMDALGHYTIADLVTGMPALRGLLKVA